MQNPQTEIIAGYEETDPITEHEEFSFKSIVRPGSVVVMLAFFIFVVLSDGNIPNFNIKEGYYPMIETIVTTVVVAFFGMRGIEKTAREWQRNDYRSNYTRRKFQRYQRTDEYPEYEEDYANHYGGYRNDRYRSTDRYDYNNYDNYDI